MVLSPTGRGAAPAEEVEPEALVVTHFLDSGVDGDPYAATIRLRGQRAGIHGRPGPGDSFVQEDVIDPIVPGAGPVSLSTWVYGLTPGEWSVSGEVIRPAGDRPHTYSRPRLRTEQLQRATWSWRRWALSTAPAAPIKTRWALLAPLARQPAVVPGVYTALAVVGFVFALALQATILARQGLSFESPLVASLVGTGSGLVGAKAWYKVLNPHDPLLKGGGWAVDGFLMLAPLIFASLLFAWDQPIGVVLDATAPGIFFAVAIGRVGCFLTGCCAGRCSASRWGIWSSDRRIGARRIPAQLFESAAGLALGIASLLVAVNGGLLPDGAVFLASFMIYAAVRQVLLRFRAERRREYRTLPLTAAAAGLVSVVLVTLTNIQGS